MEKDAAVVICVEQGMLEYKALCLVLTLRRNWGAWANVPIYCYSPRQGRNISIWLAEIFQNYGVTLIDEPLNQKYFDYPLANKPLSMAHAETNASDQLLIFLDSDILCWHPPLLLELPDNKNIGLVPDTTKTVASSGPDDPNDEMWQALYQLFKAKHRPLVETSLTREIVHSWWGSGVIAVRKSAGLMKDWLSGFERALETINFESGAIYLREQMTLCALVAREFPVMVELPVTYNFPVQNHDTFRQRGIYAESAILWHYQPFLNKSFRKFSVRLNAKAKITDKERVALTFIEDLWANYPKRIGLDEPFYHEWRARLKVGTRLRAAKNWLFN